MFHRQCTYIIFNRSHTNHIKDYTETVPYEKMTEQKTRLKQNSNLSFMHWFIINIKSALKKRPKTIFTIIFSLQVMKRNWHEMTNSINKCYLK